MVTTKGGSPGTVISMAYSHFPKDQYDAVIARYQAGESATAIARSYGVTHHVITRVLHRANVPVITMSDRSSKARSEVDLIIEEWNAGIPMSELCARYGISHPTMSKIFNDAGLTNRHRHHGALNPCWKGGRRVGDQGYVYIWADPDHLFYSMAAGTGTRAKYFLEHRLVMAEYLGRPLLSNETVHHINGVRDDNRIENLELRIGSHGPGQKWCCADCGSSNVRPVELG